MSFELVILQPEKLHSGSSILKDLKYGSSNERNYAEQVFKIAKGKNARIHLLKMDEIPVGFVALAIKPFNDVPSVAIEYLFTSQPYRKTLYEDLGEPSQRISEYLLGYAISIADKASEVIPLRYLALQLADDGLERFYAPHGFQRPQGTDWMSIKLPLPT